jgi:hypothetical protein
MKFLALKTLELCIANIGCAVLLSASGANAQASDRFPEPIDTVAHTVIDLPLHNETTALQRQPSRQTIEVASNKRTFTDAEPPDFVQSTAHTHCDWPKRFNKKKDALAKVKRLSAEGVEATLSMQSISVRKGYQIKSPVFESVSQAREYIEVLEAAGMDDYYLPDFPDSVIQVALGSFHSGDKALSRLEHVLSAGLVADITPWMIDVPAYTVSPIAWGSDGALGCAHN